MKTSELHDTLHIYHGNFQCQLWHWIKYFYFIFFINRFYNNV
jgi:hypothetical protein